MSDLIEELFGVKETNNDVSGSTVALVDKKTIKAIARQARNLAKKELLDLAGSENISLWQQAISTWMQQHQEQKVSLWQLQQALDMPLVEIWLGLLHSPTPYGWDGQGEFYRAAQDAWVWI